MRCVKDSSATSVRVDIMDRRNFLGTGAAAMMAAVPSTVSAKRAASSGAADIAVVGAGAFGGWSALCLREKGLNILSIDAYGPASPRASSGGETRSLRAGYGAKPFYTQWAAHAMAHWSARAAELDRPLLFPNDRIELAREWTPALLEQRRIFDRLNLPYAILDQAELRRRYPQMGFDDIAFGFLETSATAAIIRAQDATVQVQDLLRRKGGRTLVARAMPGRADGRRLRTLVLGNGDHVEAGQFLFACGPWSPKTLSDTMARKVKVRRFEYHYWGLPAGDDRFSWPNQPAWHDHTTGGYGFGSLGRGIKYSPGGPARDIDVDMSDRLPNQQSLDLCRAYMAHRFPALTGAPVVGANVCQVEMTVSDDFVIDRHPDYDNVWIASGGGGHAFKFGPLIGRYVADRMTGATTDSQIDRLFAYGTKAEIVT